MAGLIDKFYLNNHPDGRPPAKLVSGVLLFYLALVLQMINSYLEGANLAAMIFLFFAIGFLVFAIGEGRKWARWILLVLVILNTIALITAALNWNAASAPVKPGPVVHDPVLLFTLFCAEVILEIIAVALVFSKGTGVWFDRKQ